MHKSNFETPQINTVIRFLTFSDLLILSAWGLINPLLAIFISTQVDGGSIEAAGLAATVFFLTKSILQLPVAKYIDDKKGEWDDYIVMWIGSVIMTISAFLLAFARDLPTIYLIQGICGLGAAFSTPPWNAIFTRHIDADKEGFEWSLYTAVVDLGVALAAGLGGFLILEFGYRPLFIIVGIVSMIGTMSLIPIANNLRK